MDSDTEVMVAPVLPPGDLNQDRVLEEPSQGEPVAETKKRKVFPFHITSELRNLYRSGMVGVGVQYSSLIDAACQRTGLSKAQVKSWIKRTKYHQRKILKQDEERDTNNIYSTHHDDDHNMSYLDTSVDDDHNAISLYGQDNVPTATFTDHPSVVLLENSSTHDVIPSLRRHVVMPREQENDGVSISLTTHHNHDKRLRVPDLRTEVLTKRDPPRTHSLGVIGPANTITVGVGGGGVGGGGGGATGEVSYATISHQTPPQTIHVSHPSSSSTFAVSQLHQTQLQQPRHPPPLVIPNGQSQQHTSSEQHISQEGARIFRKIERNFKRLEELGYQGFAFTIHGDETLLAYSGPISHCFTSPLISYLRAVIVAANPPPLIPHITPSFANSSSRVLSIATPAPSTTSSVSSRQPCIYEPNPTRIQQKTAIYELSESDAYDDVNAGNIITTSGGNDLDVSRLGTLLGPNGRSVHVVVTCDPNMYSGMDGDMSD